MLRTVRGCYSQGGRIWLVWRESVRMSTVYKTYQMITCSVGLKDEDEFFCTFVYAKNEVEDKRELWEDLSHHKNNMSFRNKAWMVMRDFNEILEGSESSNFETTGRIPISRSGITLPTYGYGISRATLYVV